MTSLFSDPSLNKIDQAIALNLGLKLTTIDLVGGISCHICHLTFANKKEYEDHYLKHNTGSSNTIYTCVICHKDIAGYASFRGHCYSAHVIKDKFKCEFCNKLFKKQSYLKDHINAIHKFMCPFCNNEFPTNNDLQLHKMIHRSDRPPYDCQHCYEKIEDIDTCELHITKHSTSIYKCPICEETITKQNATQHLTIHFGEVLNDDADSDEVPEIPEDSSIHIVGGIRCHICDNMFKNRNEFDIHFSAEHIGEILIYTCIICNKKYHKYLAFGDHCYSHLVKDRFKCEICSKPFSRLSLLILHTGAHAIAPGDSSLAFACVAPACRRRFAGEPRLRAHLRDDHGLTHLRCTHHGCKEIFETPKDLILHQKCHNMISDNWCRRCGLQFTTSIACEKHLDVHKSKSYSCPVCLKKYNEKYLLMKHIPDHFEIVFHMCKICGKVYNTKKRLMEHCKTHAKVKGHVCTICGKGFAKKGALQEHFNLHKGTKPYECIVCPKSFSSHSNWCKHLRKVHKLNPKNLKEKLQSLIKENRNNDNNDSATKANDLGPQQPKNDLNHTKKAEQVINTDVNSCSEPQNSICASTSVLNGGIDDGNKSKEYNILVANTNEPSPQQYKNGLLQIENKITEITSTDLKRPERLGRKYASPSMHSIVNDHNKNNAGDNFFAKTNYSNLQQPRKKKLKNENELMEIINDSFEIQESNYLFTSTYNDDMELNHIDPNEIERISEVNIDSVIMDNENVEFPSILSEHNKTMNENESIINNHDDYTTNMIIKKAMQIIENNINPTIVNESVAEFTRALNEKELQIIEETIQSVEANEDILPCRTANARHLQMLEDSIDSVLTTHHNQMQYAVNNAIIVPETIAQSVIPDSVPQTNGFPRELDLELGPELINTDDHIMPHIDPFLTIKTSEPHRTSYMGTFNEI